MADLMSQTNQPCGDASLLGWLISMPRSCIRRMRHVRPAWSARACLLMMSALLAVAVAAPAFAKEVWERDWIEVRSPHFVVVSALAEARTVELVQELESFRAAAEMLTNIGRFEERIPTRIYVLPYAVPDLGFGGRQIGYFESGMRANYAVVIPARDELDEALKHEYVHFLVHNRDETTYPTWFDEGFAVVLQTLRARGTQLEFGKPIAGSIDALSHGHWLPFGRVLEARGTADFSGEGTAMFYSQSWCLVHYLTIGRPDKDFAAENREYLRLSETGVAPVLAFEQAFGLKVAMLRPVVTNYARNLRYFQATMKRPFPIAQMTTSNVATDRIAAELGLLALLRGNFAAAQRYYDAALAANPANAMALVGTGDVHKNAKRFEQADPYYQKAIALEPRNPLHELDYAEYFVTLAEAQKDPEQAQTNLVEARRHFARSYKLDAYNAETLAMNGSTYLGAGEDHEKAVVSLEAAHQLVPSHPQIRLLLARAYVAAGQPDKARAQLRALLAWADARNADAIRKELAALENRAVSGSGETSNPASTTAAPH